MTSRLLYDVILFDFDYTLADASGCLLPALRAGLRSIGVTAPNDLTLRQLIGIPLERQFALLAPDRSGQFDVFRDVYVKTRDSLEASGTILIPGTEQALMALDASGGVMAIVTAGSPARIERTLRRFRLQHFFQEIAGAKDKSVILARFGSTCGRGRCAYVGDRPEDGTAARRANVAFIGVCTGAFGAAAFHDAFAVLPSIATLPGALRQDARGW